MTYREKQLVANLREHTEWVLANEWETPITLGDDIEAAANTIAELSAKLESKEEKLAAMNLDLVAENEQLKAEIGFWRPRAEAAKQELETLRPCYCCEHYRKELAESGRECDPVCREKCVRASEWAWRGPCVGNGGMKP